jgi:hypothetical protein
MSDTERAAYAAMIGAPWWLWTLVYARNQAAPLLNEIRRFLTKTERR